jgi:hypothetical protein
MAQQHETGSLSLTLDARSAAAEVVERGERASELLTRFLAGLEKAGYKPRQIQIRLERSTSGALALQVEADVPGLAETYDTRTPFGQTSSGGRGFGGVQARPGWC